MSRKAQILVAASTAPLTAHEEADLFVRWRERGDAPAAEQLVRSNLKLVLRAAHALARRGLSLDEMVAEGSTGLVEALRDYDAARGVRFSTHAMHAALRRMREAASIEAASGLGGNVLHRARLRRRLRRDAAKLAASTERALAVQTLADELRISPSRLEVMLVQASASNVSLDAPASDEADASTVGDMIPSPEETPEDRFGREEQCAYLRDAIDRAFTTLDARERLIIARRAPACDDARASLQDIACELGISRQRVSQLEDRAHQKLMAALHGAAAETGVVARECLQ